MKQGNVVAHFLTQSTRHSFPILVWMESIPSYINKFVAADLPAP